MKRMRRAIGLSLGVLALAGFTPPAPSLPGTHWQERACAPQSRWCVEWVRILEDGRMEIGSLWHGEAANRVSSQGDRTVYLRDESGRRYDHTATSGAAAFGGRGYSTGSAQGSFFFPAPRADVRRLTLHDDTHGRAIPGIALDPARFSSLDKSRALLGRILAADSISIVNEWVGFGPARSRRIELSRAGEGFAGRLSESTGRRDPVSRPLQLPGREAERFLKALVESACFEGTYKPIMTHTDDYPGLQIEVTAGNEKFVFSSASQGEDHVPWALQAKGRSWVVPSSHPARALRLVEAIAEGKMPAEATPAVGSEAEPLRIASQLGDVKRVKELLAGGADPARRTAYDGQSALTAAALWGQTGSLQALLDAGADPRLPNAEGLTAFQIAAAGGHAEIVKLLVGRAGREEAGRALFDAATHGSAEMLRSLLAAGAPVEAVNPEGRTPLNGAIIHGHLEAVRILIAAGADVHSAGKGWPPLHTAAHNGHVDVVELLLRSGAPVDATYAADGTTALFRAYVPDVAAALLRAGAQVNARRKDGATPLIDKGKFFVGGWSAYSNRPRREPPPSDLVATARVLLDAGAEVGARDAQGLTALQTVASNLLQEHSADLAILLLERGADPNRPDAKGRTPLWHATANYIEYAEGLGPAMMTPLIEALLKAGARNLPDAEGVSPLDLAARSRSATLPKLLQSRAGSTRAEPRR